MSEDQYPCVINLCGSDFVTFESCQLNRRYKEKIKALVDVKASMITSINRVVVESLDKTHECLGRDHSSINTIEGRSIIVHHCREDIVEAMKTDKWK